MDRNDVFLERRISLSKNVAVRKGAASFSRHQTAAEIKTPLAGDLSEHAAGAAEPKGRGLVPAAFTPRLFSVELRRLRKYIQRVFFQRVIPPKSDGKCVSKCYIKLVGNHWLILMSSDRRNI